jgi:hypothetical protein
MDAAPCNRCHRDAKIFSEELEGASAVNSKMQVALRWAGLAAIGAIMLGYYIESCRWGITASYLHGDASRLRSAIHSFALRTFDARNRQMSDR